MKKTITIILAITILSILTLSLSGCLMVTLREKEMLDKFDEQGFTVMHTQSLIPFSDERMQGLRISKCFTAYKNDETIHDEFGGITTDRWEVSVYFMEDSANATKLVEVLEELESEYNTRYEETLQSLNNGTTEGLTYPKKYTVYRYNDIVIFGDWQSVSLVRGY
ncbi:MAG: hypothetical protein J6S32_04105 [Clostridia bacterium]|nr:hypothetical protein [Clostridia bacterium]